MEGHYLDYAATSAIRPPQVAEAVFRFLSEVGATPGRGGHRRAVEAGRVAFQCRKSLARILGVPGDPSRIVFGLNATQGLNTALSGVLAPGEVVVTTPFDHNSVLRPIHYLERERGVRSRMIPGDASGALDLEKAREALEGARLLVVNAVSNVLGTRLPMKELGRMAREAGALFLVDGAQWAGHYTESLPDAGADMFAFTGHKGLLGPQGIGGLWVKDGVELSHFFSGGTGGNSDSREMPSVLPDALEAGSGNAPAMAGLAAGVAFLEGKGVEELHRREQELKAVLWGGLESLPGVRVLSPPSPDGVGIVSVVPVGMDPGTLAQRLDREWGVMVRYGLNCAPEVHKLLGTGQEGAVRFSLGWASTLQDVEAAVRGVDAITSPPTVSVS
jgi:cysteine desulfurase/selenocysteine lyase